MTNHRIHAFISFRVLRISEIEAFYDKLEEGERHPDHECDDLWDEHEPILHQPLNSHLD